jgi:hypothetical protein
MRSALICAHRPCARLKPGCDVTITGRVMPSFRFRGSSGLGSCAAALALALTLRGVAVAQDVTEPALKAAFIYNFARFTTWPADLPATDSFVICVLGDAAVTDALARAVAGRQLMERPIAIASVVPGAAKRECRILYVAGVPARQAADVVGELKDAPVLTISNIEGFASAGGMTQFFFESGQLRFRIHNESAKRAGLQISSRLLVMARPQ